MVEQLPTYKKTRNAIYRLIERSRSTILYEVLWHTGQKYYEVHLPRIYDQQNLHRDFAKRSPNRKYVMPVEQYKEAWPKDKDGGKRYWFYPTLELAQEKYRELLNKEITQN